MQHRSGMPCASPSRVCAGPVPGLRAGGDVLSGSWPWPPARVLRSGFRQGPGAACVFSCATCCVLWKPASRAWPVGRDQPWRCLWRRFSQMTMTRPLRRITLHLSQIFLTLGWTFIASCLSDRVQRVGQAQACP